MLKTYVCKTVKPTLRYPRFRPSAHVFCALLLLLPLNVFSQSRTSVLQNPTSFTSVPQELLVRIMRAEDTRRWDNDIRDLLSARSAVVRSRAALAAGRIGNEAAVSDLIKLLSQDDEMDVRAMAAFALGEIESASATDALTEVLGSTREPAVRARAIEALGKVAAALPKELEAQSRQISDSILKALTSDATRPGAQDRLSILMGLTAALRAKTSSGGPVIAGFLKHPDSRIRSDAANTLARLKLKDGNDQLRKLLVSDRDPIVRANAARVLAATEDKSAYETLLGRALNDLDARVRISAIRALTSLKDPRAAAPLLERGRKMLSKFTPASSDQNELLEIATTLGRLLAGTGKAESTAWLRQLSNATSRKNPEPEIAFVRISAERYLSELGDAAAAKRKAQEAVMTDWRTASSLAQALGEIAALPESTSNKRELARRAEEILRVMLDYRSSITINTFIAAHSEYAIPAILQAFAAFKPKELAEALRKHLIFSDVIIRATAAELLGELPPDDTNTAALSAALIVAFRDFEVNDASLAILEALGKQDNALANDAIKSALHSTDHIFRRRAIAILKKNGVGDFSSGIGTVRTRNTTEDYERAIGRIGKSFSAVVTTSRGEFTIQLLPEDAPLTVDNFVRLAKVDYFRGITIHRVVPNFVMQDGDPRGDGNGGPGYQIRCEINQVPYARGTVGMALSGKDTGGSQWFATHSPQPHLDGGYTVFGKVIRGMEVVDNTVRGDVIRSVVIKETAARVNRRRR